MKKYLLLTVFVIWGAILSYSQRQNKTISYLYDSSTQPAEMFVDILHADIRLTKIDPVKRYFEGNVRYNFKTLRNTTDSIVFNTKDITVKSVTLDGQIANKKTDGENTIIYPPKKLEFQKEYSIYFEYTANPSNFYFIGWDDKSNTKRKTMWALALATYVPCIPIKHDLFTSETYTTFDQKYQVLSNGNLVEKTENADGTATWHYKMTKPHAYYLISHFIGEYGIKKFATKRGVPLEYWYFKDRAQDAEINYIYSPEMFDFLEMDMGFNFPWDIYQQAPVMDCPFGGMECTSATIYNENLVPDKRSFLDKNYILVNCHELVHQWFGNFVSYTNSQNIWTSESFATYYEKKFEQWKFGEDVYQNLRLQEYQRTMESAKTDDYPVGHEKGATNRWYPKGSLVIDMMRYVMGENEFKQFIKHLLTNNQFDIVEGNDYKEAAREATGQTLDWFFDEWIYKGGEPHYQISYNQKDDLKGKRNTHIYVRQIQDITDVNGLFKMPIVFEVNYKDGSKETVKKWIEKELTEVIIPNQNKKEIAYVLFDPNRNILKKTSFARSFEELSAQFSNAENMIDRYDALLELKNTEISKKRDLLIKRFENEKFFLIKNEIIAQLTEDNDSKTLDLLKKAINDKDVEVRRSVVNNIKVINEKIRVDYEKLLKDSSYNVVAASLKNLCENFPKNIDKYLEITKNEVGIYGKNVRCQWLEIAIENKKGDTYLKELIDYSDIVKYEYQTALTALQSLKRLNYFDANLCNILFRDFLYNHPKISDTAKDMLTYYAQQNTHKRLLLQEMKNLNVEDMNKIKVLVN